MILFLVGVIEMLIITVWTKFVSEDKIVASGMVTVVNILIWYYVLQTILEDINNWPLISLYALGCAIGTMAGGYLLKFRAVKTQQALSKPKENFLATE